MSSLIDILMLSKFLKTHFDKICMKLSFPQGFLRMRVSPKNHQKFDIIVLSEFFKIAKWTKFVWNWVSPKNHPKFDILVMSEFFKIAKWTKFVWNWVSPKNHPKFDILVMSVFKNSQMDKICMKLSFPQNLTY